MTDQAVFKQWLDEYDQRINNQSRQKEHESANSITIEDLFDKTIYPYRDKEPYLIKERGIKYKIIIPGRSDGEVKHISVLYEYSSASIFITESIFNKYWQRIQKEINSLIWIDEPGVSEPNKPILDLSLCNTITRKCEVVNGRLCFESVNPSTEKMKPVSRRDRLLADSKKIYVYSRQDNLFHDKCCKMVDNISNQDIEASQNFPEGRWFCPHCWFLFILRAGSNNDMKNADWYLAFFEQGRCSSYYVTQFVDQYGGTFKKESTDTLRLHCNEDSWMIQRRDDNRYILYHNNYQILDANLRIIGSNPEFHVQSVIGSVAAALRQIEHYDYHKYHVADQDEQPKCIKKGQSSQIIKWFTSIFKIEL